MQWTNNLIVNTQCDKSKSQPIRQSVINNRYAKAHHPRKHVHVWQVIAAMRHGAARFRHTQIRDWPPIEEKSK